MVSIHLFKGDTINRYLTAKKDVLTYKIGLELSKDSVLDHDTAEKIIAEVRAENIVIDFERTSTNKIDGTNKVLSTDQMAYAVRFYVPFVGDWKILQLSSETKSDTRYPVMLNDARDEIIYDVVIGEKSAEGIMQQFNSFRNFITSNLKGFNAPFLDHNHELTKIVADLIQKNLKVEQNQKDMLNFIGFPERKS